jgi:hypothetical protein
VDEVERRETLSHPGAGDERQWEDRHRPSRRLGAAPASQECQSHGRKEVFNGRQRMQHAGVKFAHIRVYQMGKRRGWNQTEGQGQGNPRANRV